MRERNLRNKGDALDFDTGAEGETTSPEGGPGRQLVGFEEGDVNLIHGLPFGNIGQEHRSFDHLIHVRAVFFDHHFDVLEGLAGLRADAARRQLG